MVYKVIFIGNPLGGDDGIGPRLYQELKDDKRLAPFELLELGVVGLDMISYVDEGDHLIVVDAIKTGNEEEVGKVRLLEEADLKPELKVVSQHDFGVEETAAVLHAHLPGLAPIILIGIAVAHIQEFSVTLSDELEQALLSIKDKVVKELLRLLEEG